VESDVEAYRGGHQAMRSQHRGKSTCHMLQR